MPRKSTKVFPWNVLPDTFSVPLDVARLTSVVTFILPEEKKVPPDSRVQSCISTVPVSVPNWSESIVISSVPLKTNG